MTTWWNGFQGVGGVDISELNTCFGGVPGSFVNTLNTAGKTGFSRKFDTTLPHKGSTTMRLVYGSPADNNYLRVNKIDPRWSPTGNERTYSVYVSVPANPGGITDVFSVTDASFNVLYRLALNTSRTIRTFQGGAVQGVSMDTGAIVPLNTIVRFDIHITLGAGTTQTIETYYFATADATTPTNSYVHTANVTTGASDDYVFIGAGITGSISTTMDIDDFVMTDTATLPGPFVARTISMTSGRITPVAARIRYHVYGTTAVRVGVSTSSSMTSPVYFGAPSTPDAYGLGMIDATGLTADTDYWYQLELGGVLTGPIGRFHTDPTVDVAASFSIIPVSCAKVNSNASTFDVMSTHAASTYVGGRRPLRNFMLGDLEYDTRTAANDETLYLSAWMNALSYPKQNAWYRTVPLDYQPSDHDFNTSNGDSVSIGTAAIGWHSAYRKYFPNYTLPATDTANTTYKIGRVRVIHLDTRSKSSAIAATDDSSKTKLGTTQMTWLSDTLALNDAALYLITFDGAWSNGPHTGGDNTAQTFAGDDTMEAYATARGLIGAMFAGKNVQIIHGDLHCLGWDSGVNTPFNIPVAVCSPIHQDSYHGNGVYSGGIYPAANAVADQHQFVRLDVTDNGSTIKVDYHGFTADDMVERVTGTKTFAVAGTTTAAVYNGTVEVSAAFTVWNGTLEVAVSALGVAP